MPWRAVPCFLLCCLDLLKETLTFNGPIFVSRFHLHWPEGVWVPGGLRSGFLLLLFIFDPFFLLAGQLVHVTWSCSFIIGWWEVKNLYMILELGRSPLCTVKRETSWWKLWQIRFGSWTRSNSKQKTRAGPARNPGTPRPGARRHGKGKNQPNHNMIQSSTLRLYTLDCLMP